jgi:hypothetical protein
MSGAYSSAQPTDEDGALTRSGAPTVASRLWRNDVRRFFEGIEDGHPSSLEIGLAAGHYDQPLDLSRRGQSGVVDMLIAEAERTPPAPGNSLVNCDDAVRIGRENLVGRCCERVGHALISLALFLDTFGNFREPRSR